MEKLKGLDLENKKVLDAGTGGCNMTKYLEDWGAEVVSVDINKDWQSECRQQVSETQFVTGDLSDMGFFDREVFDFVVCNFVISALSEQKEALVAPVFRGFHRVLKENGMLVVIDYQPFREADCEGRLHDVQTDLWRLENAVSELLGEGHLEEYSDEVLMKELLATGFQEVESSILLDEVPWPLDLLKEHQEEIEDDIGLLEDEYIQDALRKKLERIMDSAEGQEIRSGSIYELRASK